MIAEWRGAIRRNGEGRRSAPIAAGSTGGSVADACSPMNTRIAYE